MDKNGLDDRCYMCGNREDLYECSDGEGRCWACTDYYEQLLRENHYV